MEDVGRWRMRVVAMGASPVSSMSDRVTKVLMLHSNECLKLRAKNGLKVRNGNQQEICKRN